MPTPNQLTPEEEAFLRSVRRDLFAGVALIGVMVMRAAKGYDDISQAPIAEEAYELADAMLEAREREQS